MDGEFNVVKSQEIDEEIAKENNFTVAVSPFSLCADLENLYLNSMLKVCGMSSNKTIIYVCNI